MNINKLVLVGCSFADNESFCSSILDGASDRRTIDLIYDDYTGSINDFDLVKFKNNKNKKEFKPYLIQI